jgi:hypothetical protein
MTTKSFRPLLLAAFVASLTFAVVSRAAVPPAENLLPSDTLAFLTVPDCAAVRVAAKQSPGCMFWSDPAMKPFRDKFAAKLNDQFITPLERDLGVKVADFMDLPQGQLTFAVTVSSTDGHASLPPGMLLLLDAQGRSDSLKTNLAALVKKWTDAGRAVRTENIHGLAFTVVPLSSNDFAGVFPKKAPVSEIGKEPPPPEKPGEIYFAQFETLLVVGSTIKAVEPVAAHLTGGSAPAIADNAVFAADKLSQFRDRPKYYGWFNGNGFFDLLNQLPGDSGGTDSPSILSSLSVVKIFGTLGLNGLKSASFALRENHDGSSLTLHLTAPETDRAGLLKIFALPPKDAGVPAFVPADAVKFSRVRLDGKQTWAELQKMIAALTPNGQTSLNAVINIANTIGQQKNPGFDIRNDLFGNLNDDLISYQKPVAGNSLAEFANPPIIYLIAVANPDATINAIKTLAGMGQPQDASAPPREFMGRKIHTLALKSAPATNGGTAQPRSLYVSASGGYLVLSSDVAMVEEYLRSADGATKPLRENAGLTDALQHLGGAGGGLFGYENQRETMRVTFKVLKNTLTADTTLKMFPPAFRAWLDFSLLPEYDTVAKYFYLSTFAGSANADGLTFKVFTPRPPGLN